MTYGMNASGMRKAVETEAVNTSTEQARLFPQLFRALPNFHKCCYNFVGTIKESFLFRL